MKATKIKDVGFLQAPEGSSVSWHFGSKNTNQISFYINNQKTVLNVKNNEAFIQKTLNKSTLAIASKSKTGMAKF